MAPPALLNAAQAQRAAMAPAPVSPVIGGAPVNSQTLAQVLQAENTPSMPPQSPSTPSLPLGEAMMMGKQQTSANQPETPGQTFNGMLAAGATPQQAAQVASAPSGASDDYAAGYVQPGASSGIMGLLASIFGGSGGGGG